MSLWRRAMVGVFLLALALPGAASAISTADRYSAFQPSSLSLQPSAAPVLDAVGIPLSSLPSLPSVRGLQSFGSTGRYHDVETGLIFYREAAERMESNLDLAYTVTQGVQRTADTASLVLGWGAVIRGGAVVVTTQGGRALVRFTIAQGAAVGTGMLANTAMGRALEEAGIDPQYADLALRGIGLYQLGRAYRAESAARGRQPPQANESIQGACFVVGTLIETAAGARPIETIKVGDRVLTGDAGASASSVDPTTWRKITLRMRNPETPTDVLDIELLRPEAWMLTTGAAPGKRIWFDMDDIGLHGWAQVTGVEACPPIESGRGRVVLATFTHLNSFVLDVRLSDGSEPLNPTDRHRLFSATRGEWVAALELRTGEELATRDGRVRVESVARRPGTFRVYNLEVETEHCYFAGKAQILSHNNNPCAVPSNQGAVENGSTLSSRGVRPLPGTRVRPEGIPDNWRIRNTDTPGGVEYFNPSNPNESIRIMQGNPNSPYPNSRAPYARQRDASGTYLRSDGTPSTLPQGGRRDPDAHIPLNQFDVRRTR